MGRVPGDLRGGRRCGGLSAGVGGEVQPGHGVPAAEPRVRGGDRRGGALGLL